MHLLVTGASGFVGTNLVRWLAAMPKTTVLAADLRPPDDRVRRYWSPVRTQISSVALDVTQLEAVQTLVDRERISHILHCAAITPSPEIERSAPDRVWRVNLLGSLNVLEATRTCSAVSRVILLSSSGVYSRPSVAKDGPDRGAVESLDEDSPLALDNLYAITKVGTEQMAARYRVLSGKDIASIRLGPFYGPLERPSASRPHVSLPGRLHAALRAGQRVNLCGRAVARDWIYAADVADAVGALFRAPSWRHDVYNLGGGRAITMQEMVDAFVDQGLQARWVSDCEHADIYMKAGDGRQTMSIARLSNETGWTPRTSPREGVAAMSGLRRSL